MCVVVLFLNLQKNTQLIDSKNKQVQGFRIVNSNFLALVLICRLISSYNTAHCEFFSRPYFSGAFGL